MLQPLRGKVLVEVLNDSDRTESGLYISGVKDEVPHRGKVIEIGLPYRDKNGEHMWGFQPGHILHYKRTWDQNKVKHYILRREQIYAVEYNGEAYAFGDYVIVKRVYTGRIGDSTLIIPEGFGVQSNDIEFYGDVISVGRENRMDINVGDRILYQRNEGSSVRIPMKEELWSIKPRAILAKMVPSSA